MQISVHTTSILAFPALNEAGSTRQRQPCASSKPCQFHGQDTFILAPDQSAHTNKWYQFQPDSTNTTLFHKGTNYPDGECIQVLPCDYCISLDPNMCSYWWRVPKMPAVEGAAKRPTSLWKTIPLFEWEIVERDDVDGYVRTRKERKVGAKEFDCFAGMPKSRSKKFRKDKVGLKRRMSIKAVSWADMGASDSSGSARGIRQ